MQKIQQSWTYNHKLLLVTLSLLLVVIVQSGIITLPKLEAETIEYVNPPVVDTSLEAKVEARAEELYIAGKNMDMERYRQEAIREVNQKLLEMTYVSPYVDYEALKEKHGY